jgi:hypothetical protein
LQATCAASFKQTAVDDLYISHRVKLLIDVGQKLLAEENELLGVGRVHGQGGRKNLEPEDVNDFSKVASPFCLVHLRELVIVNERLKVHSGCLFIIIVLNLPRLIVESLVKFWERLVFEDPLGPLHGS